MPSPDDNLLYSNKSSRPIRKYHRCVHLRSTSIRPSCIQYFLPPNMTLFEKKKERKKNDSHADAW